MIEQVPAYRVGQQVFPTVQEAQKEELKALINGPEADNFAQWVIAHTDEIIAILTEQPRTKKVRSDKGKKRAPKTAEQKDKP